jgi:hypothetical protein
MLKNPMRLGVFTQDQYDFLVGIEKLSLPMFTTLPCDTKELLGDTLVCIGSPPECIGNDCSGVNNTIVVGSIVGTILVIAIVVFLCRKFGCFGCANKQITNNEGTGTVVCTEVVYVRQSDAQNRPRQSLVSNSIAPFILVI